MSRLYSVLLVLMLRLPTCAEVDLSSVPEADIEKIQAALPEAPRVKPAKERKVLVFTLCRGFKHSSIPFGALAFKLMGEKTGAFSVEITDDLAAFEPDNLKRFDAVLMDNTTGDLFATPNIGDLTQEEQQQAREREARLKQSFLDFVRGGGGLIGVHAAADCLYKWTDYGDMLGGYFSGHPWHEDVGVKLDDPGHPLCAAFKGQNFRLTDEIYQFRDPYSRGKLRVLLSLDTPNTNMDKGEAIKRTDDDFAVAWVHRYGEGRVFYCSLGHREEIFWNPAVLQHYLDGIQFALGDLEADTTPSAELTEEYLAQSRRQGFDAGVAALFDELTSFELGGDATNARLLNNLVVQAQQPGNEAQAQVLTDRLAALLGGNGTHDCKVLACRALRVIGTEAAVPALAALLTDVELSDMARYALQSIPGKAADDALLAALPKATGSAEIGLLNSLGARHIAGALTALTPLLGDADETIACAAAAALGELGTTESAEALLAARTHAKGTVAMAVDHGLLGCAASLAKTEGAGKQAAARVYEALYQSNAPEGIRAPAFYGLMLGRGRAALPEVLTTLKRERNSFSEAAARLVAEVPGDDVATTVAAALGDVPPANQSLVIDALVTRGDKRVAPAVLALVASETEDVSLAAMRAMETLGEASAILPLVRIASGAEDRSVLQRTARQSLERMGGAALNAEIAKLVPTAPTPIRAELVRLLGARRASDTVPVVLKTAEDQDEAVRDESLRALPRIAETQHLPDLVSLLTRADENGRFSLEDTIVVVADRLEDEAARPAAVLDALKGNVSPEVRVSLLAVLGRIAAPAALPTLYAALDDQNRDIRMTALKALADWPTPAPMDKLREVSRTDKDEVFRVLALRGFAKQLAMPGHRSTRETLQLYEETLNLAEGEQEKKTLLAGIGALRHPDAMKLLKPYLENKTYQGEAFVAAAQILEAMDGGAIKLTASRGEGEVRRAIDGDRGTRWTTGRPMQPGDWFQVDLGYDTDIETIMLDAGDVGTDYPRGYEVYVSRDGEDWGDPVATGEGKERIFTLELPSPHGRYVKLVQTGSAPSNFWSLCELKINGIPRLLDDGAVLDSTNWKLSASRTGNGEDPHNAIDGDPATRWSTGGAMRGDDWFEVDLGEEKKILKIVLDTKGSGGDYPRGYEVYLSNDGEEWVGPIAKGQGNGPITSITVLPRTGRYVKIAQTGATERMHWSIHELQVLGE